ncbi:hypothetical protein NE237_012885 [Protea cynaroides]|uniref:PAR1 protein n=1 Tax=Protea cynaroides TaxID=273540 RepID=A0A9Q0JYH6_9MAGN|nr:hypothetical protein NE237_012885 [Protea cynaroides]
MMEGRIVDDSSRGWKGSKGEELRCSGSTCGHTQAGSVAGAHKASLLLLLHVCSPWLVQFSFSITLSINFCYNFGFRVLCPLSTVIPFLSFIFREQMASSFCFKAMAVLALALLLSVQLTLGGITCEHLEKDKCAYAISSGGERCVLEKIVRRSGEEVYTCRTSEIEADHEKDWIETDQCIEACGLDRNSLGISSDFLLESQFTQKLCSPSCYDNCPNIVDLYFNLAAGEGVFLPKLCEAQGGNTRRAMSEIQSSGLPMTFMGVSPAMPPN